MDLKQATELRRSGKLAEAESGLREMVLRYPFSPQVFHLLGMVLLQRGQAAEALEMMQRSVALSPDTAAYHVNLAGALGCLGRHQEVMEQLTAALSLGGGSIPELHNHLGATLDAMGRVREAAAVYENCLRLKPDHAPAQHNLGFALQKLGRLDEAAEAYRQAINLQGGYSKAAYRLAGVLGELGSAEEAIAALQRVVKLHPRSPTPRSALLYTLHYSPNWSAEAIAHEHREWGRRFCEPLKDSIRPHENDRNPDRRLRIGYLSPDLREHTVTKFISAAIQHHDRTQFELFCYSDAERPDHVTERIKAWVENRGTSSGSTAFGSTELAEVQAVHGLEAHATERPDTSHWRETRGLSDAQLEELIRADRIDILVDLRGHAADNRLTLFARKPAPVQVNMVGYFNTTGLSAIDYRITDGFMDCLGQTEHLNVEKLVRLKPSSWCYSPEPNAPEVEQSPCVKNGFVTFGSLNKIVKISEPCERLWAKVLDAVPESKLMLSVGWASPTTNGNGGQSSARLSSPKSPCGFPKARLILVGKTASSREYLRRFNEIDIALDTFPFNGITTTCDGLWMGVPCVTVAWATDPCPGHGLDFGKLSRAEGRAASVSRAGASILHAAGLGELVADCPNEFVRIASELAADRSRLIELRRTMRDRLRASALLDHVGFARKLENAYRTMWRSWCAATGKLDTSQP